MVPIRNPVENQGQQSGLPAILPEGGYLFPAKLRNSSLPFAYFANCLDFGQYPQPPLFSPAVEHTSWLSIAVREIPLISRTWRLLMSLVRLEQDRSVAARVAVLP